MADTVTLQQSTMHAAKKSKARSKCGPCVFWIFRWVWVCLGFASDHLHRRRLHTALRVYFHILFDYSSLYIDMWMYEKRHHRV
jgi:hypothetical protein